MEVQKKKKKWIKKWKVKWSEMKKVKKLSEKKKKKKSGSEESSKVMKSNLWPSYNPQESMFMPCYPFFVSQEPNPSL